MSKAMYRHIKGVRKINPKYKTEVKSFLLLLGIIQLSKTLSIIQKNKLKDVH